MPSPMLLLVDDAPDIGVIVRRYGRQAGLAVAAEPSAEAAWLYLQQARPPDLVVLDVNLPGASGFDLCRRLRAAPEFTRVPVALFSHWHRPREVAAGLSAGTDFLLSKDLLCQPEEWQRRIGEILEPPAGRWPDFFLRWLGASVAELSHLTRELGPALAVAAGGWLDTEVLRILLGRAWKQANLALSPGDLEPLLTPDGLGIDPDRLIARVSPDAMRELLKAFAEQTWCLLGSAGCAPFWAALAAAAPPSESPPLS